MRYSGDCGTCGEHLAERTKAWWDGEAKIVTCVRCEPHADADGGAASRWATTEAPRPPITFGSFGDAGGSALAEYEKRHARREHAIDARWGRLAGVVKFLSDDPQSTFAWAKGAVGEQRLASYLQAAVGGRAVLLNDRAVPRTRGNIDHIVVAGSGVWIIDAKNFSGLVERRNVGGWFRPDVRLFVGNRDRSKLAKNLGWQIHAVKRVLGGRDVPVFAALCFTDAEWRLFAKPFNHNDIMVTWAKKLAEMIAEPGPLATEDILDVACHLMQELPSK